MSKQSLKNVTNLKGLFSVYSTQPELCLQLQHNFLVMLKKLHSFLKLYFGSLWNWVHNYTDIATVIFVVDAEQLGKEGK